MEVTHSIETGYYNLYYPVSLADKYLLLNASGNYADLPSGTVIINLETEEVKTFDFGCSINCTDGENFYTIGSEYDDNWQAHYTAHTISISTLTATDGFGVYTAAEENLDELTAPMARTSRPSTRPYTLATPQLRHQRRCLRIWQRRQRQGEMGD